ncbi:MAG: acetylglutamate kinase [Actinobacteria bacterium]|nr:acetylglutamate kinase [Actinomycetota bacterium]
MTRGTTESARTDPQLTAKLLTEVLPYIQRWRDKVVVIKFGGNAMIDDALAATFASDMVLLRQVGILPVVVHGGGPQIGDMLRRLGKESVFEDGLRVTDAETLDIARMVLVGKVNREIVGAINMHGPLAVGLSGQDAGIITAKARDSRLGFVGDVSAVNSTMIERMLAEGLIPVISTIGADAAGQAYNINADTVAGAIASSLGAEKIIYLTDVAGLLADVDNADTLISRITSEALRASLDEGELVGGMIPKITAAVEAVEHGVSSAHLLDGRVPHVMLIELFTDSGIGTLITKEPYTGSDGVES